mmetsp:Transcript_2573/g.2901  ORF Transcript_2573/g.2901 Transcript_2573/m.2901 type:complete len:685 (+) Transcript_2573:84-2138(+)
MNRIGALASKAARRLSFDSSSVSKDKDTSSSTGLPNQKNVGILALEVYTPSTFVSQESLEEHYGVSKGRYTIGLGQDGMAICGDCEDVNSLALTVVQSLLDKYEIDPSEIGRLEVGTETLVDKSKSTKTILMDLFPNNSDIEGATVINACYGGTAALLNAFTWVESDGWDGRYAIVVAADIATYARGSARPTCGAGAVAVLVGRDAPIAFADPRLKATHASNVWDFYKSDHNVEYPTVDGALSQVCYYRALEDCYTRFADKMDLYNTDDTMTSIVEEEDDSNNNSRDKKVKPYNAEASDYFVFHAPYNKLVQKSYARLWLMDARRKYQLAKKQQQDDDDGIINFQKNEIHNSTKTTSTTMTLYPKHYQNVSGRLLGGNPLHHINNHYSSSTSYSFCRWFEATTFHNDENDTSTTTTTSSRNRQQHNQNRHNYDHHNHHHNPIETLELFHIVASWFLFPLAYSYDENMPSFITPSSSSSTLLSLSLSSPVHIPTLDCLASFVKRLLLRRDVLFLCTGVENNINIQLQQQQQQQQPSQTLEEQQLLLSNEDVLVSSNTVNNSSNNNNNNNNNNDDDDINHTSDIPQHADNKHTNLLSSTSSSTSSSSSFPLNHPLHVSVSSLAKAYYVEQTRLEFFSSVDDVNVDDDVDDAAFVDIDNYRLVNHYLLIVDYYNVHNYHYCDSIHHH